MMDDVLFSQKKNIGLITLNRPASLNALTLPMIMAMQKQLNAWQHDASIHAVVIQATPGKAFCAGGDVRWLYHAGLHADPLQMQFFWHEYRLNHTIHRFPKPFVALMNGVTMGGGVGISLHGSHAIASEHFVFAMPETAIGFFPDIGASYLLSRCPNSVGFYLALTGQRIGAGDAEALGLVHHVIPSEHFSDVLSALLSARLAADAHDKVTVCLQSFSQSIDAPIKSLYATIDEHFHHDSIEHIFASLHDKHSVWSEATLKALSEQSPLSLKVTLAQLQRARQLSLTECLKMDFTLVKHFVQHHDFYEGVRALLIDKDKKPRWQPSSINAVDSQTVERYFRVTASSCGMGLMDELLT